MILMIFQLGQFATAITADPSLVGETLANLYVQTTIKTQLSANDKIRITLPQQNEVSITQGSLSCSISGDVQQGNLACSASGLVILITLKASISAFQTFQVNILGSFKTPTSTAETSTFTFETLNSGGTTVIDSLSSGITLGVQPDSFTSASMTQVDSFVVGAATSVTVRVEIQNQLLAGSQLKLVFPKWNPAASTTQLLPMISNPSSVKCTSISNVNSNAACVFDTSSDTLTLTNGFPTGQVSGTVIQFQISSVRNALSYAGVTIQIRSLNQAGTGVIEQGTIKFTPTSSATIPAAQATTSADITTVQELSNFRLEFQSPVPLNAGTIVSVVFPVQFSFEQRLTEVQGFGLFGSIKSLTFSSDNLSVKITSGIDSYKAAAVPGVLIFKQIRNPFEVKASDSFSIFLTDANGFQIAQVSAGITFTPTAGTVDQVSLVPTVNSVNSQSDLILAFQPKHALISSSQIQVQLPTNLQVNCDGFKKSSAFSTSITCTESSNNMFIFNGPFASSSYSYSSSQILQITFVNIVNPLSQQPIKGISITTYSQVIGNGGSSNFVVDTFTDTTTNLYGLIPSMFMSQSISASTTQTFTDAVLTLNIKLDNGIPLNGKIVLVVPSEVTLNTISCAAITNMDSAISCSKNGQNITVINGFKTNGAAEQATISFSVSGIRTPPSTQTTSTFKIYSMDSNSYLIDQVLSLVTITMTQGKFLDKITTSTSSNIVSSQATMSVSVKPPSPVQNGDKIYITIPAEITPPTKQTVSCQGADALKTTLTCEMLGNIVVVTAALATSPSTANSAIITVRIFPCNNPKSTKKSSEFALVIRDKMGYSIVESVSGNGGTIQVGQPSTITQANFTALDFRQLAYTAITIRMKTNNFIPAGGYLEVSFDRMYFQVNRDTSFKCTSNLVKNELVTCVFNKEGQFLVQDLFPADYVGGSFVDFTINNVNIDVTTKMTTPSWTVISYTNDGYQIDKISDGLSLVFPCNSPCQTCQTNSPTYCLSCNALSGKTILYNNKCWDTCPNSQYYDSFQFKCMPCDIKCKSCNPLNPSECLTCNPLSAEYPFLSGNTCQNTCSFGFYGNSRTGTCDKCTSPCASCSGTPNNCTSCEQSSSSKFLNGTQCLAACPPGTFVTEGNVCLKCDSTCLTCQGSANFCTSCASNKLLSLLENSCVDTCPFGKTIYNAAKKECELCDPKCQTCETKKSFCTSCQTELNLRQKLGECVGECSTDKKQVGFNGICVTCDLTCLTCVNNPSSCLSCSSGLYLYNFQCVKTCPQGYEPNEFSQCVINGLRCPFGQEVNPLGTSCILKAQICENGFKLNIAKDKCIPAHGYFAPFPLCFSCLFLSMIVILSWIKYRNTLVISNIIAIVSLVETIGILMLIILSYQIGVYSTFGLALVALLFLYGSNLFFAVVFMKQIHQDSAFKYWGITYKITNNVVVILGSVINFKVYRVIYARFFGRDNFNASFEDPEHFFKPFTFISVFSVVTTMLPILVACIIGLVFVEFGYQVQMTCIEMFIIEVALLAMMIYEKIKLKKYALKQNQYLRVGPKFLDNSQVNVMSSLMDDQSQLYSLKPQSLHSTTTMQNTSMDGSKNKTLKTEENILTMTSNYIKTELYKNKITPEFQEYYERRRHLEKLISQIYSKDATISKGDTLELITKLHEEEILRLQHRVCKSSRDLREADDDFVDNGAGDPELQNFISAPVSPREKEMLNNPFFMGRLVEFKRAMRQRDQYDNCYAEGKPAHYFPLRDTKLVSVKVQTNLLELLAIDDMTRVRSQNYKKNDASDEEYIEENLNPDYVTGLIDDVLDQFQEHQFTKQRRRLPRNRLAQIPYFDLTEIMGEFEVDPEGFSLIIKGKDGKLNDREGRRVNKKGYLIDIEGNIISNKDAIIFRADEIDTDDEIPAPFYFEKKSENKYKIEDINIYNQKTKKKNLMDQEDEIEKEYRKLREKNTSNHSSVESLMGENPRKYNKQNKRVMPGDEDGFLSKIVQPMQAKTKTELLRQGTDQAKTTVQNLQSSQRTNRKQTINNQTVSSDGAGGFRTNENSPSRMQIINTSSKNEMKTQKSLNQQVSIGGYETSVQDDQSARDLFFSALAFQNGINQVGSRAQGGGRNNHSTMISGVGQSLSTYNNNRAKPNQSIYSNNEVNLSANKERYNKIQMLKESLGNSHEDQQLLKQLQKFEQSINDKDLLFENKKPTLAKKNLSRVYGKVQDRLYDPSYINQSSSIAFPNQKTRNQSQMNLEDDYARQMKRPQVYDTRLKDLENIYIKAVHNDRKTASSLNKKRYQGKIQSQSAWDINVGFNANTINTTNPGTTKPNRLGLNSFQDNGLESSDQDEMKILKQIDQMQAIIDKGQKANAKFVKPPAPINKKLFDGGWI
ncbi:UNKNOWN [Stylonychia lemnae]|uniref:FU domain containing protein n=1 Tax=Stylonychia lemnae TaxID=5949 RepID=A0A078A4T3_STYLE|nr:UNKNOWN [Stylonychia lemnae]|eukprot:CDW75779.1 UNKNOWN [Stylonychia lemnae]